MTRVLRLLTVSAGVLLLAVVAGCAATYRAPVVFQPMATATTHDFFCNGLPIAAVQGDSCAMFLGAEPARINGVQYLRVWWLYANQGHVPVLVEPLADIAVVSRNRTSGEERRAGAEPPSRILQQLQAEAAANAIGLERDGRPRSIAATADEPGNAATIASTQGAGWDFDRPPAHAGHEDEAARARLARDLHALSTNDGVLRRNTVPAGKGVHGYVYVPWPTMLDGNSFSQVSQGHVPVPAAETEHRIVIRVGAYADSVLFTPGAGE